MNEKNRFLKAVSWAFAMNWGQKGIAAGITLILAAIIGPSEFGLVAIASVFIFFVSIFVEQGLHVAIVQRKELEDEHVDATFWFTMAMSTGLAVAGVALSGWWAKANAEPRLQPILIALSGSILLTGLTIVPQALLAKRMAFKALAINYNLASLVGGGVGITMALQGFGVWALVLQRIISQAAAAALLWRIASWRPGFRLSSRHLREMLSFSSRSLLARLADFLGGRADVVVMGLLFGPIAVGMYKFAERIVSLPLQLVARSVTMPALSHLSEADAQGESFQRRVCSCLRLNAALVFPAMAVLAVLAPAVIGIVGQEWSGAELAFALLAAAAIPRSIMMQLATGIIAAGKPQIDAAIMWMSAFVHLAGVGVIGFTMRAADPVTQAWSIAGVHTALAFAIDLPLHVYFLRRITGVSAGRLLAAMAPGLIVVLAIVGAGAPAQLLWRQVGNGSPWIEFLVIGAFSGAIAAGVSLAVFPDIRARVLEMLGFAPAAAEVEATP